MIGASLDSNDIGFMAGNVYVFQKEDSVWVEKQKLSPKEGEMFPAFGRSIKTKGDYLFVGAPGSSLPQQSGGVVYVYKIKNGNWEFLNKITSPFNVRRDYFGYSLFIEDDSILIGSPGEPYRGERTALTYLYKQTGDDFVLEFTLIPSDSNYFDSFGIGVSMNNGEYLIGAYAVNKAYLFTPYPTSVRDSDLLLNDYSLFQNYPNPFNPSTTISYSVARYSLVSLKVYDILGIEKARLVNETKEPGNYSVSFDASNLSSGIYFYTLKANGYSFTKKMLLVR